MFDGIKSLAFLLHETKIGKGGGVNGRNGGEQETPPPAPGIDTSLLLA